MAAAQSLAKNLVHPRAGLKSSGQTGGLGGRAMAPARGKAGSGEVWLEGKEATGDAKAVFMNESRDMTEKMMEQKRDIFTKDRFMTKACNGLRGSKGQ